MLVCHACCIFRCLWLPYWDNECPFLGVHFVLAFLGDWISVFSSSLHERRFLKCEVWQVVLTLSTKSVFWILFTQIIYARISRLPHSLWPFFFRVSATSSSKVLYPTFLLIVGLTALGSLLDFKRWAVASFPPPSFISVLHPNLNTITYICELAGQERNGSELVYHLESVVSNGYSHDSHLDFNYVPHPKFRRVCLGETAWNCYINIISLVIGAHVGVSSSPFFFSP